jgi:hypothetical protein
VPESNGSENCEAPQALQEMADCHENVVAALDASE